MVPAKGALNTRDQEVYGATFRKRERGYRNRVAETPDPIRIGTSGWSYRHWRKSFYPEGLPSGSELAFVAARFDTVEVNRTFYSLVRPAVFARWRDQVPDDFVFAVKGSRFITHQKKLGGVEEALANFLASGLTLLGEKLGPILWQLPTNLATPPERIEAFLDLLPRDPDQVVALARMASLPRERRAVQLLPGALVRHALELRHPMDLTPRLVDLARERGICLAASQSSRWPLVDEKAADFRYLRLHGPGNLYASSYSPEEMAWWARRVVDWARETRQSGATRVFVYFDNDEGGRAPRQALELRDLIQGAPLPSA